MSALRMLQELNGGRVMGDLNQSLSEVLAGVVSTGGKGEVTLKLKVEFEEENGQNCAVAVQGEVKHKVPRASKPKQTHYVKGLSSDSGLLSLSRRDPSQPTLPGMPEEDGEAEPQRRTVEVIDGQSRAAADTA